MQKGVSPLSLLQFEIAAPFLSEKKDSFSNLNVEKQLFVRQVGKTVVLRRPQQ